MAAPDCWYPMAMRDRSLASGAPHAAAAVSSRRPRTRSAPPVLGHPVAELLPSAQRHDAVAGARPLSHPQDLLRPELQPGRPDHARLSVHGVDVATAGRPLHRPAPTAVFPDHRHRPHADRPPADVARRHVSRDPDRRHADRHGLVDLPSRGLARGAHGGRRTLWARTVPLPGRWERRLGLGPTARRLRRRPARAVEHRVVLGRRADRDRSCCSRWAAGTRAIGRRRDRARARRQRP